MEGPRLARHRHHHSPTCGDLFHSIARHSSYSSRKRPGHVSMGVGKERHESVDMQRRALALLKAFLLSGHCLASKTRLCALCVAIPSFPQQPGRPRPPSLFLTRRGALSLPWLRAGQIKLTVLKALAARAAAARSSWQQQSSSKSSSVFFWVWLFFRSSFIVFEANHDVDLSRRPLL